MSRWRSVVRATLFPIAAVLLAVGCGGEEPASPPERGAAGTHVRGEHIRLIDEIEAMGYSLPLRNLPHDTLRLLSAEDPRIEDEPLDPEFCARVGWFRGDTNNSWLCRTRFPIRIEKKGGEAEPLDYEVRSARSGRPLRRLAKELEREAGVWMPNTHGFMLQLAAESRGVLPRERFTASYPVDGDLLAHLDWSQSALTSEQAPAFIVGDREVDGDLRPSLYGPAPSSFVFPLEVSERARLKLAVAVLEEGWLRSDGVEFRVKVRSAEEGERLLAETSLDPARRREHRRWIELDVDLAAYAGRKIELVFETGPGAAGNADFDFAAIANPIVYRSDLTGTPVVLIDIDTLRADHLDLYGYARSTSPVLQRFADEAIVFESAVAQAPWTLPSQMSIVTGLRPGSHRVFNLDQRLAPGVATLASLLRERGYTNQAITDAAGVSHRFGFNRGFDSYWEHRGNRGTDPGFLPEAMRRFRSWFDSRIPGRFFLFFHTYETHFPYVPPPAILTRYDPDYVGTILKRFDRFLLRGMQTPLEFTPRDLHHLVARYDGEIRYVDQALADILSLLRSRGVYDDALLIFVSDHGEEFHEHGGFNHGQSFFEEMVRVPFLIRFPRGQVAPRRIRAPVELVDLVPTVLDFLGYPIPEGLDGRSLMPLIRGEEPEETEPRYAITDGGSLGASLRSNTHKLIRMGDEYSFYDLAADPEERVDIYDPADPLAANYRERLEAYLAQARSEEERARPQRVQRSPELDSQLRALGYIE